MEITLIRHLPTIWNKYQYLQGKRDIPISFPLDTTEREQIAENQSLLNHLQPFDQVFVSELKRTKQTAKVYGFQSPVIDPLLNELDYGIYEGMPKNTLLQDFGYVWSDAPLEVELGETLFNFQQRIICFLVNYSHLTSLLIFGHGTWIRALLSLSKRGDINDMNKVIIPNNQLNHVTLSQVKINTMREVMTE